MSSSVSQIDYWRSKRHTSSDDEDEGKTDTTTSKTKEEGGPGATYLSYDMFMGLSVLGGFFALDHLYLRSPLTFLAKFFVNIFTLGSWWLYDASHALFNRDTVKVFGLGVPTMGPKGIGAGVLAKEIPDKKHLSFLVYSLALLLGGLFGLDSFLLGDKQSGIIRLVSLLSFILAPLAIAWWIFKLYKFFFKTKNVVEENWEYFGAPPPEEPGVIDTIIDYLPTQFLGPLGILGKENIKGVIKKAGKIAKEKLPPIIEQVKPVVEQVGKVTTDVVLPVAEKVTTDLVIPVATQVVEPITTTAKAGINTVQTGLETVKDGIELGKTTVQTTAVLADKALNTVGKTANAATKALALAPAAAALTNGITKSAAENALKSLQTGGGVLVTSNSNVLPYVLLVTLGLITVSGLILTYRRSRENGKQSKSKDDQPPKPRIL
jgi:hypothetical protein